MFVSGVRLGNMYCDPLITSGVHKISGRQRWTPAPMQLQILERIFDQESGTPSKQKIKEITADLTQHGQISETNVYNWFQNRRARSKRKQQAAGGPSNNVADSEVETEAESSNENKSKPEDEEVQEKNHSVEPSTGKPESVTLPEGSSRIGGGSTEMPFYDNMLSNPSEYLLFSV